MTSFVPKKVDKLNLSLSETAGWIYTFWSSMELSRPAVVQYHGHLALTLDFQGQILKILYLRNGRADWHGTKGMRVDRMLDPYCDFELWPHPWPSPLIFKVKFWKSRNSGMGCPIDMEPKGCESTECWTNVVILDFQGQTLKMLYPRNGRANWHGTRGMWVDRMLDSHCDFELWPHPWSWPCIFKVNFLNSCESGTRGPIMERKGYESIGCFTYYVTLSYDFYLEFWRSNFKKALSWD